MFQRTFSAATLIAIAVAVAACGGEADETSLDEIDLEDDVEPQATLTTPKPKPDPEPYLVCDLGEGWCACSGAASCDKLRDMCRKAGGDYEPGNSPNDSETGTCTY